MPGVRHNPVEKGNAFTLTTEGGAIMTQNYDVIVIGVGAMGASSCFHLAESGARVLGIEQFDIPHDRGSSHGFSRMIRAAYYEEPRYVPLLRRAYKLWEDL